MDKIREHLNSGRREVYDADLKGYFDTFPHEKLMAALAKRISQAHQRPQRPEVEEYVTVESKEEDQNWRRHYVPDVMVSQAPSAVSQGEEAATIVETEALDLPRVREPITLRRIQIVDTQSGDRVITSIEFLSPWSFELPAGCAASIIRFRIPLPALARIDRGFDLHDL